MSFTARTLRISILQTRNIIVSNIRSVSLAINNNLSIINNKVEAFFTFTRTQFRLVNQAVVNVKNDLTLTIDNSTRTITGSIDNLFLRLNVLIGNVAVIDAVITKITTQTTYISTAVTTGFAALGVALYRVSVKPFRVVGRRLN